MLITASTKNRPASRSAPTMPGAIGIAASAAMYGRIATTGAHSNTRLSAAAGVTLSFWTNLTPSATSCAQPWNPPAYIGPTRLCMCAITLCSVCPTSSGSSRNAASTSTTRSSASATSAIATARTSGTPLPGLGHSRRAGTSSRRRGLTGLARLLRAGPRFHRPGGEHELLAQRMAFELLREQERRQLEDLAVLGEVDPEHLVGLPLVPASAGVDVRDAVGHRGVAGQQGAQQQVLDLALPVLGQVAHQPEAVVELVHRGQPVEERAAEPVPDQH